MWLYQSSHRTPTHSSCPAHSQSMWSSSGGQAMVLTFGKDLLNSVITLLSVLLQLCHPTTRQKFKMLRYDFSQCRELFNFCAQIVTQMSDTERSDIAYSPEWISWATSHRKKIVCRQEWTILTTKARLFVWEVSQNEGGVGYPYSQFQHEGELRSPLRFHCRHHREATFPSRFANPLLNLSQPAVWETLHYGKIIEPATNKQKLMT